MTGDRIDAEVRHVVAALIMEITVKVANSFHVPVVGTGTPKREFLSARFGGMLACLHEELPGGRCLNVAPGRDMMILELAEMSPDCH